MGNPAGLPAGRQARPFLMNDIYEVFDQLNISYKKYDHPAVFTVEESKKYKIKTEGANTKNLFLTNQKKTAYYLVSVLAAKRVDLKKLAEDLKEDRFSFASPEDMKNFLGLTPGSVSPYGLINNKNHQVTAVVDNDFFDYEKVGFHPNVNTATVVISVEDFKKFLESTGNRVVYCNFKQ